MTKFSAALNFLQNRLLQTSLGQFGPPSPN
uniref:Uncharacterized protein n=1 Tax=Anguilla anguilla TaxID=7936 RepID=A0A0E9RXG9_ANGAN